MENLDDKEMINTALESIKNQIRNLGSKKGVEDRDISFIMQRLNLVEEYVENCTQDKDNS